MPLTERRKADRAKMATAIEALALEHGATVETEAEGCNTIFPHCVRVNIRAARGLLVSVELDGKAYEPDTHVISWHMSHDVDTCLSDSFGCRAGGLNNYHFRKATAVAYDFEGLCEVLRTGLAMAADGSAFDDERERQAVARNGETAAQRNAKRDSYWRANAAARDAGVTELPATEGEALAYVKRWDSAVSAQ